MKKHALCLVLAALIGLTAARPAQADIWGADVAVLTQILTQAIMQLAKLRELMNNAQANLELVQEINRGINDSLNMLRTINPNLDPGLYKEWASISDGINQVTSIYGAVPQSPDTRVQRDADQSVAEAITFNNSFYKYSEANDQLAEAIKDYSHQVSPGGAAKLSAQALGVVIQVLNQNLRAQSTGLKLQAQQLARENRQAKEETRHHLETTDLLKTAMKQERVGFDLPRF